MERETAPALNPADAAAAHTALALPVPAKLIDFMAMYGTEDACLEDLIAARWPGVFVCPRCAHSKGWRHANRRLIECAACGHQGSRSERTCWTHRVQQEPHGRHAAAHGQA